MEYDASGANISNVLYWREMDEVIARGVDLNTVAPKGWFYFPDRNGNTSVVTDGGNLIRESYRYDAFGLPTIYGPAGTVIGGTAIGNRFMFTGREWRSFFGFYEYRARAYDPTLGRFLSEDPKGFDAGDYNLNRYCANDPMDKTDPMGLDAVSDGDGTFHFEIRNGLNVTALQGAYVTGEASGKCYQCLGAAQFLTGTRTKDAVLHDAPRHEALYQGEKVSAKTPNGTMIGTGFRDGKYPNESKLSEDEKKAGYKLNHTAIKTGFDESTGKVTAIGQNASRDGSIQPETHNVTAEGWYVVKSKEQFDDERSKGVIRPAPVIQKTSN